MKRIKEHLDSMEQEVAQLRKITICGRTVDHKRNQGAWTRLTSVSDEISKQWKGPSAVEEIRSQREKVKDGQYIAIQPCTVLSDCCYKEKNQL